jgi:hypothetical protein
MSWNTVASARVAILLSTVTGATVVAGCALRDDSGWSGTSVMTVHWERYKSANSICRRIVPPLLNESDPPQIAFGCRKVVGTDCYIYTDDSRPDIVGSLVQDCLEQIRTKGQRS